MNPLSDIKSYYEMVDLAAKNGLDFETLNMFELLKLVYMLCSAFNCIHAGSFNIGMS